MKILLASAALAAACLVVPAAAAPQSRSVAVRIADLDLSTRAGAARLERRVHRAAVMLCGTASGFDLTGQNDARRCVADARRTALASAWPGVTEVAGR